MLILHYLVLCDMFRYPFLIILDALAIALLLRQRPRTSSIPDWFAVPPTTPPDPDPISKTRHEHVVILR